jgi:hypothetical protein
VVAFAVVSTEGESAVDVFVCREDAERFLEDARADEPELAEKLGSSRSSLTRRRASRETPSRGPRRLRPRLLWATEAFVRPLAPSVGRV